MAERELTGEQLVSTYRQGLGGGIKRLRMLLQDEMRPLVSLFEDASRQAGEAGHFAAALALRREALERINFTIARLDKRYKQGGEATDLALIQDMKLKAEAQRDEMSRLREGRARQFVAGLSDEERMEGMLRFMTAESARGDLSPARAAEIKDQLRQTREGLDGLAASAARAKEKLAEMWEGAREKFSTAEVEATLSDLSDDIALANSRMEEALARASSLPAESTEWFAAMTRAKEAERRIAQLREKQRQEEQKLLKSAENERRRVEEAESRAKEKLSREAEEDRRARLLNAKTDLDAALLAPESAREMLNARMKELDPESREFADALAERNAALRASIEAYEAYLDILSAVDKERREAGQADPRLPGEITRAQFARERAAVALLYDPRDPKRGEAIYQDWKDERDPIRRAALSDLLKQGGKNISADMRVAAGALPGLGEAIWDARRDKSLIKKYFLDAFDVGEEARKKKFLDLWTSLTGPAEGLDPKSPFLHLRKSLNVDQFLKSKTGGAVKSALGLYSAVQSITGDTATDPTEGAISGGISGLTLGETLAPALGVTGPLGMIVGGLAGALFGGGEAQKRARREAQRVREQQLAELRKLNNAITPVSDYFRSMNLNLLPTGLAFGGLETSYAVMSSRGVR